MTNTLAFVSIKGGVGKTTVALETATSLVKNFDKKVLLVDANFSAPNIGLYLDISHDYNLNDAFNGTPVHNAIYECHGVDIIAADLHFDEKQDVHHLKRILAKFKKRYDYIILDSSPNYEELKPVIAASDKIFLVTSPDNMTLETTLKAAKIAKEESTPIAGIIINKIRNPKYEFTLKQIEDSSDIPVMARIPDHKKMAESIAKRTPISILDKRHPIAKEVKSLAGALSGVPEKQTIFFIPKNLLSKEKINRSILKDKFQEENYQFNP